MVYISIKYLSSILCIWQIFHKYYIYYIKLKSHPSVRILMSGRYLSSWAQERLKDTAVPPFRLRYSSRIFFTHCSFPQALSTMPCYGSKQAVFANIVEQLWEVKNKLEY